MRKGAAEFTRFEHEGWERAADKYDSVWSSLTRQFIPHLIDTVGVSTGMSVLDVACGPGYVSAAIKERGANPTGIDFSRKMVAIARSMFPEVTFRESDAQQLPFTEASFDRVLVNFGLLHLSRPERACAEAFRVLRAGGKLYVDNVDLCSEKGWEIFQRHRQFRPETRPAHITECSTPQELEEYLWRAGFEDIQTFEGNELVSVWGRRPKES